MTDWGETSTPGADILGDPSPPAEFEVGISPNWLLLAAAGAVAVGALALAGGIAMNLFGYVASSLATFTLVALFRRRAVQRSAALGISAPRNLNLAALALLAIGFALSLVHAWLIASHFS